MEKMIKVNQKPINREVVKVHCLKNQFPRHLFFKVKSRVVTRVMMSLILIINRRKDQMKTINCLNNKLKLKTLINLDLRVHEIGIILPKCLEEQSRCSLLNNLITLIAYPATFALKKMDIKCIMMEILQINVTKSINKRNLILILIMNLRKTIKEI